MSSNSRYEPLGEFLNGLAPSKDDVSLTFARVEEIIEGPLPPSARKHSAWWANDKEHHVQSFQWLKVGWHVSGLDIANEMVTFSRDE